jgi:hypothetical protein
MCPAPGTFLDREEPGTEPPRPIRRFVARSIDLMIAWIFVVGLLRLAGSQLILQSSALLWILTSVLWVFLETLLLSIWRTTPGKWLLRIQIESLGDGQPGLLQILDRSFTVFCRGLGCMVPGVYFFCAAIAYQDLKYARTTRWDRGRFRITHATLGPARIALLVLMVPILFLCVAWVSL